MQEPGIRALPVVWNTTVGASTCPGDHKQSLGVRNEGDQILHWGLRYSLRQLGRIRTERQLVHDLGVRSKAWKHAEPKSDQGALLLSASHAGFRGTQCALFKNTVCCWQDTSTRIVCAIAADRCTPCVALYDRIYISIYIYIYIYGWDLG